MKEILQKLTEGKDLDAEEAELAMQRIMKGESNGAEIAGFLVALKMKGETTEEITAFAKVMKENSNSIHPKVELLVDTCGTGGDNSGTFNISTTSAFIAAGAGVPIAKHGNRSVSSKCGSADVLEELGAKMLQPSEVEKCIEDIGIGFMFAPYFHPAMKHVMPARKALGIRTVFNVLGPLTNPAGAQAQVLGVFDESMTEKMAEVLLGLGTKHALVVNGEGTDEIVFGKTKVSELKNGKIETYIIDGKELGFEDKEIPKPESKDDNAKILENVLKGEEGTAKEISILNAAAAIYVGGKAGSIEKGINAAREAVDSGKAYEKLKSFIEFKNKVE